MSDNMAFVYSYWSISSVLKRSFRYIGDQAAFLIKSTHKSIWMQITEMDFNIICQRQLCGENDINGGLKASWRIGGEPGFNISYFYGCGGNGTLAMNTWIATAKQIFPGDFVISGRISDNDLNRRHRVKAFYEKFGFIVTEVMKRDTDYSFSASLDTLKPLPHKVTGQDYYLSPGDFVDEGGNAVDFWINRHTATKKHLIF